VVGAQVVFACNVSGASKPAAAGPKCIRVVLGTRCAQSGYISRVVLWLQVCADTCGDAYGEMDNSDQSHDTAGPAVPSMHAEGACGGAHGGESGKADEEYDGAPVYETRHMADPAKVRIIVLIALFSSI
jgi:hypothetical protein